MVGMRKLKGLLPGKLLNGIGRSGADKGGTTDAKPVKIGASGEDRFSFASGNGKFGSGKLGGGKTRVPVRSASNMGNSGKRNGSASLRKTLASTGENRSSPAIDVSGVGVTEVYRDIRVRSCASRDVNWKLMHKAVPDTLFEAKVKNIGDLSEISETFGVSRLMIERNWTVHMPEAQKSRPPITEAERQRRIEQFAKPVDPADLTRRLIRAQEELYARVEEDERNTDPRNSDPLEYSELRHTDANSEDDANGPVVAEVSVEKLRYGEVHLSAKVAGSAVDLYSNGEIFVNGQYDTCVAGFGSRATMGVWIDQPLCDAPRLSETHQMSVSSADSSGALERLSQTDAIVFQAMLDGQLYYRAVLPRVSESRAVEIRATYPRSARVRLGRVIRPSANDAVATPNSRDKGGRVDIEMCSPLSSI